MKTFKEISKVTADTVITVPFIVGTGTGTDEK